MVNIIQTGVTQAKSKLRVITVSLVSLTVPVVFVLSGGVANAATSVIYNNIPNPQPGNLTSEAFEATSTSEFGGQVQFVGSARQNPNITILMSSWGCQSGHWYSNDCTTSPGSTFPEIVTLNIYAVNSDNSPGAIIATQDGTFQIPYRPSADSTNCTGGSAGKWYSTADHTCYNGFATPISFSLSSTTLPDKAIISVAYNTTHYGYAPIGESATCFSSPGGCGYDSLNVALTAPPTVGTDPVADSAYLNSLSGPEYCDDGVSGTGSFRLDSGCWTGIQPAIKVTASSEVKPTASATGGVTLSIPRQQLSFEAHDNGTTSGLGNANYTNFDANLHYNADLTCVNVIGDTAYFAYQIPPGNFVSGTWVVWKVVDGGSPGKGHDTAGFVVAADSTNATSLCQTGNFTPTNYAITGGNLVVHKN